MPGKSSQQSNRRSGLTVVILAGGAQSVPPDLVPPTGTDVLVAGPSRAALALIQLALPEARTRWTDLKNSASIRGLHRWVDGAGRIGRLIVLGGRAGCPPAYAELGTLLHLMPVIRLSPDAEILLFPGSPAAHRSLRAFVTRLPAMAGHVSFHPPA